MLSVKKVLLTDHEEACGQINVIIGPNNSGKSTFLRELASIQNLSLPPDNKWLSSITIEISGLRTALVAMMPNMFTADSFEDIRDYRNVKARFFSPHTVGGGNFHNAQFYQSVRDTNDDALELNISTDQTLQNTASPLIKFALLKSLVAEMCDQRIQVNIGYETQVTNINDVPGDIVGYFWRNPMEFTRIQRSMKQAFGIEIGFDNLIQASHPVRILPKQKITGDNRLPATGEEWEKKSPRLSQQGDGIKAYYKILLSIEDKTNDVILIDEPESFLHPPQRRDLGKAVVKLAVEDKKQLFISTHDSEFLRGVLDSNAELRIFYINGHGVNVITSEDLKKLTAQAGTTLKSNLLNERVLNSFFYKKTIICESENDRSFYEHAAALYHWEQFQDVNFIGVTGKEFALPLYDKLQALHIHVALVLDVDYLLEGKLPQLMKQSTRDKINSLRSSLSVFLAEGATAPEHIKMNRDRFKQIGRKMLIGNASLLKCFEEVIDLLRSDDVHVVPIGEIESFTGSDKNDLDHALQVIRTTKKRQLSQFLKSLLAH